MEPEPAVAIDLDSVHAELAARAGAWRLGEAGDVEHEIARKVSAEVPGGPGDVAGLLLRAERQTRVEPLPPMGTPRPPVRLAKQVVRRVTVGPLTNLASQVAALGATLVAAARALEERVARLEARLDGAGHLPGLAPLPDAALDRLAEEVRAAPGTALGAVVQVGAGDGRLLARLRELPAGAWGIDQDPYEVVAGRAAGLDVRLDPPFRLGAVPAGTVGVVVLGPLVDVLALADLVVLLREARSALVPGATLIVATCEPVAFVEANPLLADLAPGRPLRVETWAHLLQRAGFGAPAASEVAGVRLLVSPVAGP